MQKLLEYTRAAFAQRLNGDAAFTDGFEQRLNNLLSAGHDEIDAGVQTARFVGAIVPGGEPVGHDDAAVQLSELVRASNAQNTGNVHVEKAKHYLSDHLTQEIRTEDVAAAVGVSPYHLSRLFRALTGMTMREYLTQERIETARQLLAASDRSIPQIASLLRFCDQSYFTKVFRELTGQTPRQYRERNHR